MHIPQQVGDMRLHISGSHQDVNIGSWSSLIGIITAICGNILISFALNTQRYAHMRLGHDREQSQEKSRADQRRRRDEQRSYGTEQEGIAEERARKNAESIPEGNEQSDGNSNAERQPLIPKIGSRKSSSTTSNTYVDNEKDEEKASKSYLKSPIWWLGISMMVVGEAGNFLAYGFAPASIVSPLGVVALVSNCLIAPLLLHEEFRARDGLGVIIAIGGCVTVVLSASGSNPKLDPEDIWDLITEWEFETYLAITVALIIALMIASNKIGHKSVLIDLGLVGLFGGYTALSTKGVASLLSNKIWRVFTFPITYLLVAVLVITAVMQIKYVNRALQRFSSTIVIPTQFVLFTISVIVGSAILYRDFEKQSVGDAAKFFGGCALTFLGVWCITSGRSSDNGDDSDDEEAGKSMEDSINIVDHEASGGEGAVPRPRSAPLLHRENLTDDTTPQLLVTSPQTSVEASTKLDQALQASAGPANRSAVHQDMSTGSNSQKHPKMHATTSAPVIPTLQASTPVLESQFGSVPNAHLLSPSLLPQTPETRAGPHRLLSRQSIVDLLPGPLMSPLSSSLTAIVADSLRRGMDHTSASTVRGRPLRFRRRQTGEDEVRPMAGPSTERHSIGSADLNIEHEEQTNPATLHSSIDPRKGRMRSLSATISEIFSPSPSKR